jgi:hypothetical protein
MQSKMMINKKLWIFLLIFTITQSCNNNHKPKYDDEEMLIRYLQEKQNLPIIPEKNYAIAIMQIGMCGACTEFNKTKVVEYFAKASNLSSKILILSDKDEKIQQYFLSNCRNNLTIFLDNGIDISKYGLRYSKDVLIKIQNKAVYEYTLLYGK